MMHSRGKDRPGMDPELQTLDNFFPAADIGSVTCGRFSSFVSKLNR